MDNNLEMMARHFFGYGHWDAPYWFIGPEEGKGPKEAADNTCRVQAWLDLGKPELCDCCEFHKNIQEQHWHREFPKPRLQPTWRPLILLLKTFLQQDSGNSALRVYQRSQWGNKNRGETCIIELSGLAARNLKEPGERERYREERIETIRDRMNNLHPAPVFVVMYGLNARDYFEKIAGRPLVSDEVVKIGSTLFALTPHPNTHGRTNEDWIKIGKNLRISNTSCI